MRWTPIASAIVTIAGSPSGTAATASDTAESSTSSPGLPRHHPAAATSATIARQMTSSVRPTLASRCWSGVAAFSVVASRWAILPELGAHAGRDDLGEPRAPCHGGAHEDGVASIRERRVARDRLDRLLYRQALAGQRRFVAGERVRFEQPRVGGDDVAGFEAAAGRPAPRWPHRPSSSRHRGRHAPAARSWIAAPGSRARPGAPAENPTMPFRTDDRRDGRPRRRLRRARPTPRMRPRAAR